MIDATFLILLSKSQMCVFVGLRKMIFECNWRGLTKKAFSGPYGGKSALDC